MGIDAPVLRGGRLSRATISTYAAGSIGTGGFATLPGLVLTYYLTDSLGVAALMPGVIVTVAKVWDVVIDPVVGALSDADLARHGSRRRLMLVGAISLPVLFALTFAVPPALAPRPARSGCSSRSSSPRRRSACSRCRTSPCPPSSPTATTSARGC